MLIYDPEKKKRTLFSEFFYVLRVSIGIQNRDKYSPQERLEGATMEGELSLLQFVLLNMHTLCPPS